MNVETLKDQSLWLDEKGEVVFAYILLGIWVYLYTLNFMQFDGFYAAVAGVTFVSILMKVIRTIQIKTMENEIK